MNKREIFRLKPPSNTGIIGGGQLGRMLTVEAKRMGYNVIVLDPKSNSPVGQVTDEQIVAAMMLGTKHNQIRDRLNDYIANIKENVIFDLEDKLAESWDVD